MQCNLLVELLLAAFVLKRCGYIAEAQSSYKRNIKLELLSKKVANTLKNTLLHPQQQKVLAQNSTGKRLDLLIQCISNKKYITQNKLAFGTIKMYSLLVFVNV